MNKPETTIAEKVSADQKRAQLMQQLQQEEFAIKTACQAELNAVLVKHKCTLQPQMTFVMGQPPRWAIDLVYNGRSAQAPVVPQVPSPPPAPETEPATPSDV